MAVATAANRKELGRELALEPLDLYLETKSVVTYTGTRPTNPFGL